MLQQIIYRNQEYKQNQKDVFDIAEFAGNMALPQFGRGDFVQHFLKEAYGAKVSAYRTAKNQPIQ